MYNNNNSNDDFSWMSNGINSNKKNNQNINKNKSKHPQPWAPNPNEYSSGVPMSKSGQPMQPFAMNNQMMNRPEFLTGVPMSKSMPPSHSFNSYQQQRNNYVPKPSAEFHTGVPMSKSGRPLRSQPQQQQRKEFLTGISMSKSMPPSNFINSYQQQRNTPPASDKLNDINPFNNTLEFNSGVPMSKSGAPLPSFNGNGKLFNDGKARWGKKKEYVSGVPMSKSQPPASPIGMGMHTYPMYNIDDIPQPTIDQSKFDVPDLVDYPSYDTVIAINDILKRDKTALKTLRGCLEARGWCKITYPEKTNTIIKSVMDNVHKWFNSTDSNEKLKYSRKLDDGKPNQQSEYSYNRIPGFKEGLRILTGDIYKIHAENDKYPDGVKDEIQKISKEFDGLSVKIMKSIYDTIYNLSDYKQFGDQYDISMLNDGQILKLKYSMLDFVNYYNDKEYIQKIRNSKDESTDTKTDEDEHGNPKPNVLKSEFNVFAHSDPGLFALSFASTNEGLEMYDYVTKKWIPIGLNEGIWWNGKTANIIDNKIKSGEHRIKIDSKTFKPRFTGWYEVSCNKQLKPEVMKEALDMMKSNNVSVMNNNIIAGLDLAITNSPKNITSKAMSVDSITDEFNFPGVPASNTNTNTNTNTAIKPMKGKGAKMVEFDFGIPMGKNNIPNNTKSNASSSWNWGGKNTNNNNNNNEYNFGMSNSKSAPMDDDWGFFKPTNNEFNSGVPNSKNNNPAPPKNSSMNEYQFGVPPQKVQLGYDDGKLRGSGVPGSKLYNPLLDPSNNNNNNNNNNNYSKKKGDEYMFGAPNSKNNNSNPSPFNEYGTGIPPQKVAPPPQRMDASKKKKKSKLKKRGNEYNSGVPNSKDNYTPPPKITFNEYGSGVPASKMWAPLKMINNNDNNNNNNYSKKKKKSNKGGDEYDFGVPMSKSGF